MSQFLDSFRKNTELAKQERLYREKAIASQRLPTPQVTTRPTITSPSIYGPSGGYMYPVAGQAEWVESQPASAKPSGISAINDMVLGGRSFLNQLRAVGPGILRMGSEGWMDTLEFLGDKSITGRVAQIATKPALNWMRRTAIRELESIEKDTKSLMDKAENKWMVIAGNALGSLATSAVVGVVAGVATRNPAVGTSVASGLMTLPAFTDTYNSARSLGHDPQSAVGIASLLAVPTYYMEKIGLRSMIGASPSKLAVGVSETLEKMATTRGGRLGLGIVGEAGTETSQQAWDNVVNKIFLEKNRPLWYGLLEAGFGGAIGGGVGTGVHLLYQTAQLSKESFEKAMKKDPALRHIYDTLRSEGLSRSKALQGGRDILDALSTYLTNEINTISNLPDAGQTVSTTRGRIQAIEKEVEEVAREREQLRSSVARDATLIVEDTINRLLLVDHQLDKLMARRTAQASLAEGIRTTTRSRLNSTTREAEFAGQLRSLFDKPPEKGTRLLPEQQDLFQVFEDARILEAYRALEVQFPDIPLPRNIQARRDQVLQRFTDILAQETGTTIESQNVSIDTGVNIDGTYNVTVEINTPTTTETVARTGRFETNEEALFFGKQQVQQQASTHPELGVDVAEITKKFNGWKNERDAVPLDLYERIEDPTIVPLEAQKADEFRLADQVYDIIKTYASKLFTRGGAKGTLGAFYKKTGNIYLKGETMVSVAGHELMHAIAEGNGLPERIAENDPEFLSQLESVYSRYYPQPNENASATVKAHEGLALAFQKMLESPTQFRKDYPEVAGNLFDIGGKYTLEETTRMYDQFRKVISNYQNLNALQRSVAYLEGKGSKKKPKTFSLVNRAIAEVFDSGWILRVLEENAGHDIYKETTPLVLLRSVRSAYNATTSNITRAGAGFYAFRNNEWKKVLDYNWADLWQELDQIATSTRGKWHKDLENTMNEFNGWLASRRGHFAHKRLESMKSELESYGDITTLDVQELTKAQHLINSIGVLEQVLKNDMRSPEALQEEYEAGKFLFETPRPKKGVSVAKMYDDMMRVDLDTMKPMIDPVLYDTLVEIKGYTPLARTGTDDFLEGMDEVVAQQVMKDRSGIGTKQRTGGLGYAIRNPLISSIYHHQVVSLYAYKNNGKKELLSFLNDEAPDFVQEIAWTMEAEKTPGVMTFIDDGKRRAFKVDGELFPYVDILVNPTVLDGVLRTFNKAKQMFTTGTTGLFLPFFVTNATTLDPISATINTKTAKITPIVQSMQNSLLRMKTANMTKEQQSLLPQDQQEVLGYMEEYINLFAMGDTITTSAYMDDKAFVDAMSMTKKGDNLQESIENVFRKIIERPLVMGKQIPKSAFLFISELGFEAEILNRMGEYVLARKSGDSQLVASNKASEVTTNFTTRGRAFSQGAGLWLAQAPYFTSTMNTTWKYARMLGTKKNLQRSGSILLFLATLQAMALASVVSGIPGESEEDRKLRQVRLSEKTADERAMYMYYAMPGGKLGQARLENFGGLASLINMATQEFLGMTEFSAREYMDVAMNPVPQQFKFWEGAPFIASYFVPPISTMVSALTGERTFPTGADIVPKNLQSLPKHMQKDERTSWLATMIEQDLMSPIEIDFYLESVFGRSIKMLTKPEEYWNVLSSFAPRDYPFSGRLVRTFFEERARLDVKIRGFDEESKTKDGKKTSPQEVLKIKNERAKLKPLENKLYKFSALRKQDPNMDNSPTKKAYVELITSLENYYR